MLDREAMVRLMEAFQEKNERDFKFLDMLKNEDFPTTTIERFLEIKSDYFVRLKKKGLYREIEGES